MRVYAKNKKAYRDLKILDKYESGISLTGSEVKSIRNSMVNLSGGFVFFERGEAWLYGVDISKWKTSAEKNYDPYKKRKLLLKRGEIDKLTQKTKQKGVTVVPLKFYPSGKMIKLEIALVKGRKGYEKKLDKINKEQRRKASREVKEYLK